MAENKSRVTQLNNDYTQEKNNEQSLKQKSQKFFKRRMTFIVSCGVILLSFVTIPLIGNVFEVNALEQEKAAAEQELEELVDHQDDLEYYTHLLQDEDYVAKLARSEYYLTQDNEIVFSFPDDETSDHQEVIQEEEEEEQEEKTEEESSESYK